MIDKVKQLLTALGVELTESDDYIISLCVNNVEAEIKNFCNVSIIPPELEDFIVNRVAGQYMKMKKDSGQLKGFDLDMAVKSLKMGDTDITYADGSLTVEQRLDDLIKWLIGSNSSLIKYRRLSW